LGKKYFLTCYGGGSLDAPVYRLNTREIVDGKGSAHEVKVKTGLIVNMYFAIQNIRAIAKSSRN
jgi:hypothetical protein